MNIIMQTSTVNTTVRNNRPIKYIVLHYTAGTRSAKGAAKNVASYFSSGNAGGSADFIVDDELIVQYNPNIKNRYCWSVGGSKYSKVTTVLGGTYYNKCTNINSISIEMCSQKVNKKSLSGSDTDWSLSDKTVDNAVKLTKYLMEKYNIPVSNVIMHHHVTGKICPNPWCVNPSRLSKWNEFKQRLIEPENVKKEDDEMVETGTITVNGADYKITKINKEGRNYIAVADLAAMGFNVSYDADTKNIILDNKINEINVVVNGTDDKVMKSININGNNYTKLRDIESATDGAVVIGYENGKPTINIQNK